MTKTWNLFVVSLTLTMPGLVWFFLSVLAVNYYVCLSLWRFSCVFCFYCSRDGCSGIRV